MSLTDIVVHRHAATKVTNVTYALALYLFQTVVYDVWVSR